MYAPARLFTTLLFANLVNMLTCGAAVALDPQCASGPFETDPAVIGKSFDVKPVYDYMDPGRSFEQPEIRRIRDGVVSYFAGAFINDGLQSWIAYDAERHLFVAIRATADKSGHFRHGPGRPGPRQQIRHQDGWTFLVKTAPATREQAREFACLANDLVSPGPDAENPKQTSNSDSKVVEVMIDLSRPCDRLMLTDTLVSSFSLLYNDRAVGPAFGVTCETSAPRLQRLLSWVNGGTRESVVPAPPRITAPRAVGATVTR